MKTADPLDRDDFALVLASLMLALFNVAVFVTIALLLLSHVGGGGNG